MWGRWGILGVGSDIFVGKKEDRGYMGGVN